MNRRYLIGLLAAILLVWNNNQPAPRAAQEPTSSRLRVLSSTQREIVLELTVPDFQVENVAVDGQTYQRLIVPGTVQTDTPGQPQIPTRGTWLGLPATEGVSVEILETGSERLAGYRLLPAPQIEATADTVLAGDVQEIFAPNPTRYTSNVFYPARPVAVESTGVMRDQPVAQIQFYPVQYNPATGEIRFYHRIRARVTWDGSVSTAVKVKTASPAYESLLKQTLINYDSLNRPAIGQSPSSGVITGEIGTADNTPVLKIGVTEDGLYQLTHGDLTGAGFDLSGVDPRRLTLSNRGEELPIYLPGQGDGLFDPGDVILFYGTAITNIYTTENVYWLTIGDSNGQRMNPVDGTPGGADVPPHFPTTLHAEQNSFYWQTMPNGAGQDHWFWGERLSAPEGRDYSITLNNISTTAATATVRLHLKGRSNIPAIDPDHHTKVYLNNNDIEPGGQWWDSQIIYDHEVTFSHALLNEGANTVRLELVGDTGATPDFVYHNWIELDYWDTYVAENDELLFGAPSAGTFKFEVSGFSGNTVDIFDITDPANVARIVNAQVVAGGSDYKVSFQDTAQLQTRYLALTPAGRKSPARIELDQPSNWKASSNGADYIIITHQDFFNNSLALANHRTSKGLRVATVKVEDIYDEFNHGIFNPQAIRDFLAYAYNNWVAPKPVYVLLVGDAYQDYKDNLNTGTVNYVPTQIVETDILGQTPSDNWFALIEGNDLIPEMFIGRLPAQTSTQAADMVDKVINYEQNAASFTWNKRILVVADDGPPSPVSYETTSEIIAGLLPAHYTAAKVYAADFPPGEPTAAVINQIDTGSLFVNYTGHGSVDEWGKWQSDYIFLRSDINSLNNSGKLPVVTIANCLNGFFPGPQTQISMAEEFLRRKSKGAIAVWAPTGLSYASGHRALMEAFYETVFQSGQYNLGAATTAAKIAISGQNSVWDELIETFVLFGDPALTVAVAPSGGGGTERVYLPAVLKNN